MKKRYGVHLLVLALAGLGIAAPASAEQCSCVTRGDCSVDDTICIVSLNFRENHIAANAKDAEVKFAESDRKFSTYFLVADDAGSKNPVDAIKKFMAAAQGAKTVSKTGTYFSGLLQIRTVECSENSSPIPPGTTRLQCTSPTTRYVTLCRRTTSAAAPLGEFFHLDDPGGKCSNPPDRLKPA